MTTGTGVVSRVPGLGLTPGTGTHSVELLLTLHKTGGRGTNHIQNCPASQPATMGSSWIGEVIF